jgi:drug/metabolite transporter (DMT)-like permease
MFLLFGGILFFKERYSRRQFLGLIVLICGLALFFNQRLIELFTSLGEFTTGIALIIVAAFLWASYALSQKQLLKNLPSETIMLVVYTGGVIFFIPLSHPVRLLDLGAVETALLVFTGLVTIISYGTFSEALDHLEASRISAVLATIPLITLASSRAVSGLFPQYLEPERLNLLSVAGALMVVSGSMISSLSRSSPPQIGENTPRPTAWSGN